METFPHGITTAYQQAQTKALALGNKTARRLHALTGMAYDTQHLANIDFIDAALCAIAADYCMANRISVYGCKQDGLIGIPQFS
jgi:hypothetical protein